MPNDKYNAYRNDVIDSYERERKTEHRGTILGDAYDKDGIFDKQILITRMELANGLAFSSSFENAAAVSDLFSDYGQVVNGKTKAIRVWSGNDHWLLTLESLKRYCYIIPTATPVSSNSLFSIIYWTKTFSELEQAINDGSIYTKGYAFLYHDGTAGGSTTRFSSLIPTVSPSDKSDTDTAPLINFGDNAKVDNDTNDSITIPQSWENISQVYLKTAPIHSKFQLAEDNKYIPLYGGLLCIVFKNGETFDISTFTKFSYFYTLKEVREFNMPDVVNHSIPFDWTKTGGHNVRHLPLVVVNPTNTSQKLRVLDSFDSNVANQQRDEYSIVIGSKTMFEPVLNEAFNILSMPSKTDLSFSDTHISLAGMRVAKVVPGETTKYYSSDDGSLYLKNPLVDDSEMCLSNLGNKIERIVYGIDKSNESAKEEEIMKISFPVVEPSAPEIIVSSGIGVSDIGDNKDTVAQTMAKVQASYGVNDADTTTNQMWMVHHYSSIHNGKTLKRLVSFAFRTANTFKQRLLEEAKTQIQSKVPFKIPFKGFRRMVKNGLRIGQIAKNEDENTNLNQSEVMITSTYCPPIPQGTNIVPGNVIPWGMIFKVGSTLLPGLIRGVSGIFKKKRKVTIIPPTQSKLHRLNKENSEIVEPFYAEETEVVTKNICPLCEDAVITGFDPDSTASTMAIKVQTMGQQQTVMLHHPQQVTNGLLGLRMVKPPIVSDIEYGKEDPTNNLKGAEFVAVNNKNEDVPLPQGHWLGNTPYLSIENGGLLALPIEFTPGVANGQVDVIVQASTTALNHYKLAGFQVSDHLKTTNDPDGFLSGALSLFNRARRFLKEHPQVTDLAKRGISYGAGRLWARLSPKTKTVTNIDGVKEEKPDEEPDIAINAPANESIQTPPTSDSEVDDTIVSTCKALSFDGDFPTLTGITDVSIQEFFETAKVSALTELDEEYTGQLGTGFNRNYLPENSVEIPKTFSRTLLEFGKGVLTWRGLGFELKNGFINVHTKPDYKLKMTSPPKETVYTFGNKEANLDGALWDLVDSSNKVIIGGLTKDNVLCEPLPTNIEEMVLEEPTNPDDKTTLRVYFLGFTNDEIKVSLIAPYVRALEDFQKYGKVTLASANSLIGIGLSLAPMALNLIGRLFKGRRGINADTWPVSDYDLLKSIDAKIVMRDNFMRRKVFNVADISETLAKKLFSISGYNSSSTAKTQEITITCMGHSCRRWITLDAIKYTTEDELDKGEEAASETDNPPADYPYTPEDQDATEGSTVSLQENSTNEIIQSARKVYLEHRKKNGLPEVNLLADRLFQPGLSGVESFYPNKPTTNGFDSINAIQIRSTGLRHHMVKGIKNFFKKIWKGIKKGAKKVWNGVKKVAGKVVDVGKKVVSTVVGVATNVVGNLAGGAMGGGAEAEEEYPPQFFECIGENERGILQFRPIDIGGSNTLKPGDIPYRGIRLMKHPTQDRLRYVYGMNKRFVGGFMHRNPYGVPGLSSYIFGRRFPEVYPSNMGRKAFLDGTVPNAGETYFDCLEMAGVSVYDPDMTVYSSTSSEVGTLRLTSFSFSAQELCLGDTWPTIEEVQMILNIYGQNTDLKWVSIPCNHTLVKIENYSNITSSLEQKITVKITLGGRDYYTYAIVYLNGSKLTPVSSGTQSFVTLLNYAGLDNTMLAYIFDKRDNTQKVTESDGSESFVDTNPKEADEVKLVTFENTNVLSCESTFENGATVVWNDDKTVKKVICNYQYVDSSNNVHTSTIYGFTYTDLSPTDYMEIMLFSQEQDQYITKEDLILQLTDGEMSVIGYKEGTAKTTATLKKYCKIVEQFSSS